MNKLKEQTAGQYWAVDVVKLFMSFCVVAIHTELMRYCYDPRICGVYDYIVRQAVPFFFIASGFFLFQKYEEDFCSGRNAARLKTYTLRVLKMYLLWHILYLPTALYAVMGWGASFQDFVIGLLFRGEQFMSWHLWYLLGTLYFLLLTGLLMKCKIQENGLLLVSLGIYLLSFGMTWLANQRESLDGMLFSLANMIYTVFQNGRIFTGIGYMAIGMWLARRRFRPRAWICGAVFLLGMAVEVWLKYQGKTMLETPVLAITACALFLFAEGLPGGWSSPLFRLCRNFSTVIYLVHMMWYYILSRLVWGVYTPESYGMMPFLVTLALSLGTAVVVELLRKWKIVRFLFA